MRNRTPVPREERPPVPDFTPVPRQYYRHDGWTPERQKAFIEALADTGSVTRAAAMVNMAQANCYTLRRAEGAEEFRRAWDAALDFGVKRLKDIAFERAVEGQLVPVFVAGKLIGFRRVFNDKLLIFCLRHYGEDSNGKRTTINYFSTRASAGAGAILRDAAPSGSAAPQDERLGGGAAAGAVAEGRPSTSLGTNEVGAFLPDGASAGSAGPQDERKGGGAGKRASTGSALAGRRRRGNRPRPNPSPEGEGLSVAEASATTVRTVIGGRGAGAGRADLSEAAAALNGFEGVALDPEAQAAIAAALEACAARAREASLAYEKGGIAAENAGADDTGNLFFRSQDPYHAIVPPASYEEVVTFVPGEAHWRDAGAEKSPELIAFEERQAAREAEARAAAAGEAEAKAKAGAEGKAGAKAKAKRAGAVTE